MILTGIDVPVAMMLLSAKRPTDAAGVELVAVAYHDGRRYAFRSEAHARFCFDKLGWGEPIVRLVRAGTDSPPPMT